MVMIAGWVIHARGEECINTGKPPNGLIFLMDDMGYGDCRAYPDGKVEMP